MTKQEIVSRYRWLLQEERVLRRQADQVVKLGAPAGISGQQLTGMPRGTNDAVAASIQAFDDYALRLRKNADRIADLIGRFEGIISSIKDDRARVVCRMYYALNMTDEKIADEINLAVQYVNQIRNETIKNI